MATRKKVAKKATRKTRTKRPPESTASGAVKVSTTIAVPTKVEASGFEIRTKAWCGERLQGLLVPHNGGLRMYGARHYSGQYRPAQSLISGGNAFQFVNKTELKALHEYLGQVIAGTATSSKTAQPVTDAAIIDEGGDDDYL